jgi:hypothetical protein
MSLMVGVGVGVGVGMVGVGVEMVRMDVGMEEVTYVHNIVLHHYGTQKQQHHYCPPHAIKA